MKAFIIMLNVTVVCCNCSAEPMAAKIKPISAEIWRELTLDSDSDGYSSQLHDVEVGVPEEEEWKDE